MKETSEKVCVTRLEYPYLHFRPSVGTELKLDQLPGDMIDWFNLEQINRGITKHLYETTEDLGEKKKLIEKEIGEFDNQKIVKNIGKMEKEIFN